MTVEELKNIKRNLNMSSAEIAKRSGVPFSTVHKIFCGVTKHPRHSTLTKILDALRSEYLPARYFDHPIPGAPAYLAEDTGDAEASFVSDVELAYGDKDDQKNKNRVVVTDRRQGTYTVDDYYSISDDKRVELIDGVIFDMTAPKLAHQTIILELAVQFRDCVEAHAGCEIYISPVDVQLDKDEKTMVQPDIVVICHGQTSGGRCIFGAPDLVLEVLSDSTRKKDMFIKLGKYCNAGCREYWIVDPEKESVTVYDFEHDGDVRQYTFDDTVPVTISKGECKIDFSVIKAKLGRGKSSKK